MNFAWVHRWIKTFSESAEATVDLYADVFLLEDLLLGQRIADKEELRRAFKVFEDTDPSWDAVSALRQLGALKPTVEFWKVPESPRKAEA